MKTTDVPPLQVGSPLPEERKFTTNAMVDMNRLLGLTAELGLIPATTDEADIERHRQHNKNADYWLARRHRFDHLRREHERRRRRQNREAG